MLNGGWRSLLTRLPTSLAIALALAAGALAFSETEHRKLEAQIHTRPDSTAFLLLNIKVDRLQVTVDSMNGRLTQLICRGQPRYCR